MATKGIVSVQQLNSPYREHRHSAGDGPQVEPADWFDVQRSAIAHTHRTPQVFSWPLLFKKEVIFFWFRPSLRALLSCLIRRDTIYLCWGLPKQSGTTSALPLLGKVISRLKLEKLRLILRLSRIVLVNDQQTLRELVNLGLADAKIFPYIVDTRFFQFSAPTHRQNFLLVPGDNDRDEALVSALADTLPYKIIRVTREKKVVDFYQNQLETNPSNTVEIRYKISFSELLTLYQTAHSVLLPITSQDHAAGQTSILEALACGAPVLISQGKTSSIVNQYSSVLEIATNQLDPWHEAIEKIAEMSTQNHVFEQTADQINDKHNVETVSAQLAHIMDWVGNTS